MTTRCAAGRRSASTSTGIWFASQSCTSCGVNWKCQRSFRCRRRARPATTCRGCRPAASRRSNRAGIARAPVEQLQLGVVGAGEPGGASAVLPGICSARASCRLPGLARRRHGPEAPELLAGLGVVGVQEAANARLAPADADDDLSSTASGATVMAWPDAFSPTFTVQRSTPDFASSATRWQSSVPT